MTINHLAIALIKSTVAKYPEVKAGLNRKGRFIVAQPAEYKTEDAYLRSIRNLVKDLYAGSIGEDFIDSMAELIQGQFTKAFNQAWRDEGEELPLPEYLQAGLEKEILDQFPYVDSYYADIVEARDNAQPIGPLLSRADLWAGQWTTTYEEAVRLIAVENGENMVWRLGDTEKHCPTCAALDGVVAPASVWEELDVHPKDGDNPKLECRGFRCDCTLEITGQKKTPNARDLIEAATK